MIYDLIVIGAGPAGYVAAIRAAQLGLKTACVEKRKTLGGTCLNVGCIPSKALLSSTESFFKLLHKGKEMGICIENPRVDFAQMMRHKEEIVSGFTRGIEGLLRKNRVDWIQGEARLLSSTKVAVSNEEFSARFILLATGSEPIALPFLPFDEKKVLSSTGALALSEVPKRLGIIGAGVIGVELGSVYRRLGSEVECIEFLDRICPAFDLQLAKGLQKSLAAQGILFHLSHKVIKGEVGEQVQLTVEGKEGIQELLFDQVLVAVGRRPLTEGLQLEKVGVALDPKGRVLVNGSFQTNISNIFAIGDLIDGPMLAHKASEEGVAVAELLAGHHPHINYLAIPNVAYTSPEMASVGLTEEEVKERKIAYKTATFPMKANSRARSSGEEEGFVKMIASSETRQILGVHILASHAAELIAEATLAIEAKSSADELAATCHAHPTLSEALKECALALFSAPIHL